MAEPTTTGGISLTVIFVALLGPMARPYALIAFAALAGALWPLSAQNTATRAEGAWLLLRCTLTAIILTVFLSTLLYRLWGVPVNEALAPVSLLIGALAYLNSTDWYFARLAETSTPVPGEVLAKRAAARVLLN